MNQRIRYTVNDVSNNRFYQMPKFLFEGEFKKLSNNARVLYSLLRDRHDLSIQNQWINSKNEVYLIYSRNNMEDMLGLTDKTIKKTMDQLKEFGLIQEERMGLNRANRIYLTFVDIEIPRNKEIPLLEQEDFRNRKNSGSRIGKIPVLKSEEFRPNDTEINNTEINDTESVSQSHETTFDKLEKMIQDSKKDGRTDNITVFKNSPKQDPPSNINLEEKKKNQLVSSADSSNDIALIKSNLNIPALKQSYPHDLDLIEEIEINILDMINSDYIIVSGMRKRHEVVKSALMRLNYWHMNEILRKLKENTSEIRNPKSWLQATIFNQAFENEFSMQNKVNFALYGNK